MNPTESRERLQAFIDSAVPRNTPGLLCGRRRIGKSTLLVSLVEARQGFYWEATRGEPAVQLARLGEALGAHLGVGRLSLDSWQEALQRLLGLGASGPLSVVLDEFGYVLEADSTVDSGLASLASSGLPPLPASGYPSPPPRISSRREAVTSSPWPSRAFTWKV
jgi:AAA+ ATPase superfamily predicted ATPase